MTANFPIDWIVFYLFEFLGHFDFESLCFGFEDKISWCRDENRMYASLFPVYL